MRMIEEVVVMAMCIYWTPISIIPTSMRKHIGSYVTSFQDQKSDMALVIEMVPINVSQAFLDSYSGAQNGKLCEGHEGRLCTVKRGMGAIDLNPRGCGGAR